MFNFFKKKKGNELAAPIDGKLISIENVSDQVFSQKIMGDGFAVEPDSDVVVSPVKGEIVSIFPTKHAISIKDTKDMEILLHLGIDTVDLNGKPFEMLVEEKQHVEVGDPLVKMSRQEIKDNKKDDTVILVLPGQNNLHFDPSITEREVKAGDMLTTVG